MKAETLGYLIGAGLGVALLYFVWTNSHWSVAAMLTGWWIGETLKQVAVSKEKRRPGLGIAHHYPRS